MAHSGALNLAELQGLTKEQILEKLKQAGEQAAKAAQYESAGISVSVGKGGKAKKVMFKLPNAFPVALTYDNWVRMAKGAQLVVDAHKELLTDADIQQQRTEAEAD